MIKFFFFFYSFISISLVLILLIVATQADRQARGFSEENCAFDIEDDGVAEQNGLDGRYCRDKAPLERVTKTEVVYHTGKSCC